MNQNTYGYFAIRDGLVYHYENFKQLNTVAITPSTQGNDNPPSFDQTVLSKMKHEATAYLNRMGQFYYFVISEKIKTQIPEAVNSIPTINRLIIFRHKQTAHRGLDKPKRGDIEDMMKQLDWLFSGMSMFVNNELVFQIIDETPRQFNLMRDHQKILQEVDDFIEKVELLE